ncbi:Hypothetical protein A7982_06759 [Minicystis rosea]|nr:Hypothetical protein A7982_06759 [Minicystis rosea]
MRLRFDQLGKQIGRQALGLSGATVAHDEIAPDAQHADLRHEPDPARKAERARLGLLGRLAAELCLIEIYGHPPAKDEVLACVGKLIAFRQKRARAFRHGRSRVRRQRAIEEPFLWIIAAGRPTAVLAELCARSEPGWPAAVYFGPDLFRMGIVVASELPRERSTLLVRLMAAGPLLSQAIEDLGVLPEDAHERAVAEQILLNLRHALGKKPSPTAEEQEFIMTMHKTWADARREGRDEGRAEGRAEEASRNLLTVLRVRGIAVPEAVRDRILAQKDAARLERWLERAIVAASLAEVLDEPS